jgi:transcription elongation GreA/GreB family factor
MPGSLLELAKAGQYEEFESRCLELLESGRLSLRELVEPFEWFERAGQAERLATLAQMILENVDPAVQPADGLALARIALVACPTDDNLRRTAIDLYRRVYGQTPGFQTLLEASGLGGGRPVRSALNLLDLCLTLKAGDVLISRSDGRVVEVAGIDADRGLFTLRREGRVTTLPAPEVAREYDRVAADDFRVLRQLRPAQVTLLIEEDPLAVVIGLIHAHGGQIDADRLKHELVPKYIESKEWSRWWARARDLAKRSPHVIVEGRAPVMLSYCAAGRTLEDEVWQTVQAQANPVDWLVTCEAYLREKASRKEAPDATLLGRLHDHLVSHAAAVRSRRPGEALACGLVISRLAEKGMPTNKESGTLAVTLLREAPEPGALLCEVGHEGLAERGLQALQTAWPEDWVQHCRAWLPAASASILDRVAGDAIDAGRVDAVRSFIDLGLKDPIGYPELIYWLWRGPKCAQALCLPADDELLRLMLDTLSGLGRTIPAASEKARQFRRRMKTALSRRDYEKVDQCLKRTSEATAVTIRAQLERLEGLGENVPARMLDLLQNVHPQLWAVRRAATAPWEDAETVWCTSEGLARRTAERDQIVNVKMPENARRIGEAASHGDLSENSEYKFALEERDLLRARVAAINDELSRARTLAPQDVSTDRVGIGSRVTLRSLADGRERVMTFLGPFETDVERNFFSYRAPIAQRLMGRRVGDRVAITVDARDTEFEIVALGNALAHDPP